MDQNQLKTATLDDIVFENRLKEYGAYELRKTYPKTVWRSFALGSLFFVAGIAGPYFGSKLFKAGDKALDQEVVVDLTDLAKQKEKEEEVAPPPPPPEEKKPEEVAQVKFPPPEPLPDEEVVNEEPPPTIEEIKDVKISDKDVEGEKVTEIITETPPPTDEPAAAPAEVEKPKEEEIFTTVEQQAEFPGGPREMMKYLAANIKYPPAAQRANVSGRVFLQFVVNQDGSIIDIQTLKGIGFGCDEEAARVVSTMPKWAPGRQNGRNVRSRFTLPVNFTLE
jgi:periplasmic protein TonB